MANYVGEQTYLPRFLFSPEARRCDENLSALEAFNTVMRLNARCNLY